MLQTHLRFYNEFSPVSPHLNGQEKSGHFWNFSKVYRNSSGGHLYHFILKPEFNSLAKFSADLQPMTQERFKIINDRTKERNDEIYPAIEQTWESLIILKKGITPDEYSSLLMPTYLQYDKSIDVVATVRFKECIFKTTHLPILPDLNACGYYFEYDTDRANVILILPDQEALLSNWKSLQEKYQDLPDLKIQISEGSASDEDFLKCFLTGNFVLSKNREFIHDHTTHILRYIILLLQEANGCRTKKWTQNIIETMQIKISQEWENIQLATLHLPNGKKDRFNPLVHILAQQADITLGFGKSVTRSPERFNVRATDNFNLDLLNRTFNTQLGKYDICNLWNEVDHILCDISGIFPTLPLCL